MTSRGVEPHDFCVDYIKDILCVDLAEQFYVKKSITDVLFFLLIFLFFSFFFLLVKSAKLE